MTDQQDMTRTAQIIEALIFASSAPVQERVLEKHILEGMEMRDILSRIAERYDETSGIELVQVGQGWAFRTRAEVASMLSIKKEVERPLSRAALETVSIIAYHQPITRSEIEEIRGVSISRSTMDILLELGWIKPKGRRRTPGRPLTWGTSDGFLDHFGLEDISALPGLEELKQTGLLRMGETISDRSLLSGSEDDGDVEFSDDFDEDDLLNFEER